MRLHWTNLNERDRAAYRSVVTFLNDRLEERPTIDWALRLTPKDTLKRLALLDLIDSPEGQKIREPWRSAWRLIEESWKNPEVESQASTGAYHAQHRLRAGDRSGSLVNAIVELVAPRLKVEAFSKLHLLYQKPPKRPKKPEDLFSTGVTCYEIVDPDVLNLGNLTDRSFLVSLALALEDAVVRGLDIARRIGWDGEQHPWQLGLLYRVYYVSTADRAAGEHEPDQFHYGIAPSVKLLHTVVSRLVEIDVSAAIAFVRRWQLTKSSVHLRLWAALSRDPRITPINEVSDFLMSLDDRHFWKFQDYPEIAELRARRFGELESHEKTTLIARIRKRPPRNLWPRKADADRVSNYRLYWSLRELRRIEIAGASLPKNDKAWLDERISKVPELAHMNRLDKDFLTSPKARSIPPNPDTQYDLLEGEERLKSLEAALSSARSGWDDNPAERATDWIRQPGNPDQVLLDLESIPDGGAAYAGVWECFGWHHSPPAGLGGESAQREISEESVRVLAMLIKLPDATIHQAIDGISHWLSTWGNQIVNAPEILSVWSKIWPITVEVTNARQSDDKNIDLNTVAKSPSDREPMDLDTLNTPAGKLVGVFLAACPNLSENDRPFQSDGVLRAMRDAVITTVGRSGLIARHRMIEALRYFLRADSDWTREHLIAPLMADNSEAMALWRAIGRHTQFSEVLEIIGGTMAERATDRQHLGRETRHSLVFSLVIECLHAFRDQREPAVPLIRIQQMIRSLDDEVRAYGAEAIVRFVRDLSALGKEGQISSLPKELFESAAAPFLKQVWPQERSLATPGVSRALAGLPATSGEAFAVAVDVIERFLVPFECWSMLEYDLYGEEDGMQKLSGIDNQAKAVAFLRLLDLTIGTAEGAVIPHDLANALDQIIRIAPDLASSKEFRRLSTAARRG